MSNAFSIFSFFIEAHFLNKIIIIILLGFSIYSWGVIFNKLTNLKNHLKRIKKINQFIAKNNILEIKTYYSSNIDTYSNIVKLILNNHKEKFIKEEVLLNLIDIDEEIENKLSSLATIGNIAPFVGLLGTVIGVINSFVGISVQNPSLQSIAPGIAEALYATAFGLFVAIPASGFYNIITNKLRSYYVLRDATWESLFVKLKSEK